MRAPICIASVAAILVLAASEGAAQNSCCLPNGTCQNLTAAQCQAAGGLSPSLNTCEQNVPGFCIGCCRSGEPVMCEDNITFVACQNRPSVVQYGSPAVCSAAGDCVAPSPSSTPTTTPTVTPSLTPTITPTRTPGIAEAPTLDRHGIVGLTVVLTAIGLLGLRALRRRASH
jgi:hypothetical protein